MSEGVGVYFRDADSGGKVMYALACAKSSLEFPFHVLVLLTPDSRDDGAHRAPLPREQAECGARVGEPLAVQQDGECVCAECADYLDLLCGEEQA